MQRREHVTSAVTFADKVRRGRVCCFADVRRCWVGNRFAGEIWHSEVEPHLPHLFLFLSTHHVPIMWLPEVDVPLRHSIYIRTDLRMGSTLLFSRDVPCCSCCEMFMRRRPTSAFGLEHDDPMNLNSPGPVHMGTYGWANCNSVMFLYW